MSFIIDIMLLSFLIISLAWGTPPNGKSRLWRIWIPILTRIWIWSICIWSIWIWSIWIPISNIDFITTNFWTSIKCIYLNPENVENRSIKNYRVEENWGTENARQDSQDTRIKNSQDRRWHWNWLVYRFQHHMHFKYLQTWSWLFTGISIGVWCWNSSDVKLTVFLVRSVLLQSCEWSTSAIYILRTWILYKYLPFIQIYVIHPNNH